MFKGFFQQTVRRPITYIWLFAIVAAVLFGYTRPQGLVGFWRTDKVRVSAPQDDSKTAESYQTAEFLKDGSFKIIGVIKGSDGKELAIPLSGTYTLLDTNHVRLDVTPIPTRPDMKVPLTVSFSISGNQMEMDAITASVVAEKTKYRRVQRW